MVVATSRVGEEKREEFMPAMLVKGANGCLRLATSSEIPDWCDDEEDEEEERREIRRREYGPPSTSSSTRTRSCSRALSWSEEAEWRSRLSSALVATVESGRGKEELLGRCSSLFCWATGLRNAAGGPLPTPPKSSFIAAAPILAKYGL